MWQGIDRCWGLVALMVCWAGLASAQELGAGGEASEQVEWHTDLNLATRLAAESGRPLMIVFR